MSLLTFVVVSFFVTALVITALMLVDYKVTQERKMLDEALRTYRQIVRESNRHRDAAEMAATIHLIEKFMNEKH